MTIGTGKTLASLALDTLIATMAALALALFTVSVLSLLARQSGESFFLFQLYGLERRHAIGMGVHLAAVSFALAALRLYAWGPGHLGRLAPIIGRTAAAILKATGTVATTYRPWLTTVWLLPAALWVLAVRISAMPHLALLNPDSNSYLPFSLQRTIGYPLFIRLSAMLVDEPWLITLIQLGLGVLATLLFAETMARAVRSCLAPVLIGLCLLLNWPLEWFSAHLLSDYPFFVMFTAHLGVMWLVVERMTRLRLLMAAVTIAVTIAIRPAGTFLILLAPLVLLLERRQWRRVLGWHLVPLLVLSLLICTVHWAVYDYFALSRFRGHTSLANAMLFLKQDTVTAYPDLSELLRRDSEPFLASYDAIADRKERFLFVANSTNTMLGVGFARFSQYMEQHPELVWHSNIERQERFYHALEGLSPLNARLNHSFPAATASTYLAAEDLMASISTAAYTQNQSLLWRLQWDKMLSQWENILVVSSAGDSCAEYALNLTSPDRGFAAADPGSVCTFGGLTPTWPFNTVATGLYLVNRLTAGPWLALAVGLLACALALSSAVRGTRVHAPTAVLAYSFLSLFVYIFTVSFAHVPIPRYALVATPTLLPLLASPLIVLAAVFRPDRFAKVAARLTGNQQT